MPTADADADWRKASYSVNNGACAEAASAGGTVMVRDSADTAGPVITFPARAWRNFLTTAKSPGPVLPTAIPDLRGVPLERLTALGDTVLANAVALHRQRLRETGVPLSSFSARI